MENNLKERAKEFLIDKGILSSDMSEFVVTYIDGRQFVVNDLLVEFAELNSQSVRPSDQWGLND